MSAAVVVAVAVGAVLVGLAAGYWLPPHGRRPFENRPRPVRRILLPFTGQSISRRAFEAAVRLAMAEDATLMPAFLARVPRTLPIDAPLPAQCTTGMPLLEAIDQRAGALGVEVDSRVGVGRTYRDALRHVLEAEQVDRVIVSATGSPRVGFSTDDLRWLLQSVPAEVLILRAAPEDSADISTGGVRGHF